MEKKMSLREEMRLKNILLILTAIFVLIGIFVYIEPSITGLVAQDRFLISDVQVSADKFDQEIKVEQFDDYEVKFDNALYYFTIEPEYEQDINYVLVDFIVDSSQARDYVKEEIDLYYFNDEIWQKLDTKFVKQDGRFYYYNSKNKEFGLFVVGFVKKDKIAVVPELIKNDLVWFGLLPLFVLCFLVVVLGYSSITFIQWLHYRFYLLLKRSFIGLVKFGLSLGIVVLILSLMSPKIGDVSEINLIYYAIIPLILFSLFTDVILNLILWMHRLVLRSRLYRITRNSFWVFVFILIGVFIWLYRFVPKIEGSLSSSEILIYGLLPLIVITTGIFFVFYFVYRLVRKVIVRA